MAKIIEGVFVQIKKDGKVCNEYVPLENVKFGDVTLGECIAQKEEREKLMEARLSEFEKRNTDLETKLIAFELATQKAINAIIDKYESGKIL
jgi:hypothetical protein